MSLKNGKILVIAGIVFFIAAFILLGLDEYFSLEYFQTKKDELLRFKENNFILAASGFFLIYTITTSLSLPGAGILSLFAGAIFGLLWGTILVSFAATIGATIAFLLSRYLFRDFVQTRFSKYLEPINQGIEKEGGFYLFSIRLIFVFPFFIVNLLMGLTPIKLFTYVWVSQVGMLAATILFVNAGKQLSTITSAGDILSPTLIISFALLGIFPLIAKRLLEAYKKK